MQLSNKTYDNLKFIVTIFLPALTTLVSTIGLILQLEVTSVVVAIMVAVTTFLGALIGISNENYKAKNQ